MPCLDSVMCFLALCPRPAHLSKRFSLTKLLAIALQATQQGLRPRCPHGGGESGFPLGHRACGFVLAATLLCADGRSL